MNKKKILHLSNYKYKHNKQTEQKSPSHPPSLPFVMCIIKSQVKHYLSCIIYIVCFCFIVTNMAYSFFLLSFFILGHLLKYLYWVFTSLFSILLSEVARKSTLSQLLVKYFLFKKTTQIKENSIYIINFRRLFFFYDLR